MGDGVEEVVGATVTVGGLSAGLEDKGRFEAGPVGGVALGLRAGVTVGFRAVPGAGGVGVVAGVVLVGVVIGAVVVVSAAVVVVAVTATGGVEDFGLSPPEGDGALMSSTGLFYKRKEGERLE